MEDKKDLVKLVSSRYLKSVIIRRDWIRYRKLSCNFRELRSSKERVKKFRFWLFLVDLSQKQEDKSDLSQFLD